jgi:hypothetical protein
MEIDPRCGLAGFYDPHIVLPEISDIHPSLPVEANAVADAAGRERREELRLRRACRELADGAALLKIDDVEIA